jgi:hypothetical protein
MIAALYVESGGCYFGLPNVDPWDEPRDARLYAGPHPVVAHPPCQRWGNFWFGGTHPRQQARGRLSLGDDCGCFAAALAAVRRWGGVLEHPAYSRAWRHHGLLHPLGGAWTTAGDGVGWTCEVEQGSYGHVAPKATWLYAVRCDLPLLKWGASGAVGRVERQWSTARTATPIAFRDLLIAMAESARA